MEKIAQRMAERAEYVSEATDVIHDWEIDRKLDRERALEALRRRGIDADGKLSDAQLIELLRREQRRALEEDAEDSAAYEEWKRKREEHLQKDREPTFPF